MKLGIAIAALGGGIALVLGAQQLQVPLEPIRESGQSITAAYEGWFANGDGTFSLLVGYYNRNSKEELDIPIGPANRIEPGPADQGQPTHFLSGRQWGLFTITVPKDFGTKRLTWTITANGKTTSVPLTLKELWEIAPFKDATNNSPPYLAFVESGPFVNGPKGSSRSATGIVGEPVALPLWVADNASVVPGATAPRTPAVTLRWSKYRGPGEVTFAQERPNIETMKLAAAPQTMGFSGRAATSAVFKEPGEYTLHVAANDWSGEGGRGFQCCWSNAQVKVSVKAK